MFDDLSDRQLTSATIRPKMSYAMLILSPDKLRLYQCDVYLLGLRLRGVGKFEDVIYSE
jgi:hypothetical protein